MDATLLTHDDVAPLPWEEARDRFADARFYWLATNGPAGRPHVRPVLAVLVDDVVYTSTSPAARKGRNLVADGRCSITARTDDMDVVVEGDAERVVDHEVLQRVADAYVAKYGWPPTVVDGAFDAPYGAPTAGPPPYHVFRIPPSVVYGFGTTDELGPRTTRWRF